MIKNYIKIALRNLLKHKVYSLINVAGLAIGMACCLLILLYVKDELSYDRYHKNIDRIYRVTLHGRLAGSDINVTSTCRPMAAALINEYPEVEFALRLRQMSRTVLVSRGDKYFNENRVFYADSTYFDVFTLPLLRGNAKTALTAPNSVVIPEATALKYFGDEDPIGKTLTFNNTTDYKVTGVSENIPSNSHFHFDFLASFVSLDDHNSTIWIQNSLHTYIVLQENASAEQLNNKFPELIRKYVAPQIEQAMGVSFDDFLEQGGEYNYSLQPVKDIHLYSHLTGEFEPTGNADYVTIFALIAFFILILACINFMNLATARSANRAKEVGLRKVVGSNQTQLIAQFLVESILLSAMAMIIGIFLVKLFLPGFNNLAAKEIEMSYLGDTYLSLGILIITLFVGVVAGSYPAFFLASFKPINVLRGKLTTGMKSSSLRSGLVVFQFIISVGLIISTLVVGDQLDYMRNKNLGFEKDQVVVIHRASALGNQLDIFENQLKQLPNINVTTATYHLPGKLPDTNAFQLPDVPQSEAYLLSTFSVGFDFIETLSIEMVAGRSFSKDFPTDSSAYIINEAAVKKFGWTEAIGKSIIEPDPEGASVGEVIGVMKDFHFESLHEVIKPAILRLASGPRFVVAKINSDDIPGTIADIEQKWAVLAPNQPFEYTFLDNDFDQLYKTDQRVGKIFTIFTILGIFVACLGLFGLTSFSAEQRTKEIGIRKALGASVSNIVILLSKEFTKLIAISFFIAAPISYFVMTKWLENFAYTSGIKLPTFILAGGIVCLVAWLTISYQSIKAALTNPVNALKYE
ncbi:ABC transporter permease [candidate division KSB1 bacterium]|nr:ABC transporter permease [candidate division KSB1 bacterium]